MMDVIPMVAGCMMAVVCFGYVLLFSAVAYEKAGLPMTQAEHEWNVDEDTYEQWCQAEADAYYERQAKPFTIRDLQSRIDEMNAEYEQEQAEEHYETMLGAFGPDAECQCGACLAANEYEAQQAHLIAVEMNQDDRASDYAECLCSVCCHETAFESEHDRLYRKAQA